MYSHCNGKTTTYVLLLLSGVIFAVALAGCGKSADDQYIEGKACLLNEETFESGVEMLRKFVKRFPEDPRASEVLLAIATGYQSHKNFAQAEESYTSLIDKYPDTAESYKGLFLLGYMYYEDVRDNAKAQEALKRFIETYPDSELTVSARVLVENIGLPIEEWSIIRSLNSNGNEN